MIWPSDGMGGDAFGLSVSMGNEFALIGSPNVDIDENNERAGAAYVFRHSTSVTEKVVPIDVQPGDHIGCLNINGKGSIPVAIYGNMRCMLERLTKQL